MSFHFSPSKAAQCTAYLLAKFPGRRHNYTSTLKMLYVADRISLQESGTPITGDAPFAMDNGPVLSSIYDLIKGKAEEEAQAIWSRYIGTEGYDIAVVFEPGDSKLSPYEISVLDRVHADFGGMSLGQLIEATHRFPEWADSYYEGTSNPISLKSLLKAIGKEDDYDDLSRERIEDAHFANLFKG